MRTLFNSILVLFLSVVAISCQKLKIPDHWTRDYYSYDHGAMINGKEFHERRLGNRRYIGFLSRRNNDQIAFASHTIFGELVSKPYKADVSYSYDIKVFVDTVNYYPGKTLYFNGNDVYNDSILNKFTNPDEYGKLEVPFVSGIVRSGDKEYIMREGSITFGAFAKWAEEYDEGYNVDPVRFECKAYCGDEMLDMRDCYVNKYSIFER